MKKHLVWKGLFVWLSVFTLSFLFSVQADACTAFSVKTDTNVYYGKNWDYIASGMNHVTLHLEHLENGLSCLVFRLSGFHSSSINSEGFFVTCNEVYNIKPGNCVPEGPDTLDISELRPESIGFQSVEELKDYIAGRTVLCYEYAEHIFYGDKSGDACVVETDNEKHYLIESDQNFLAATNFPLYTLNELNDFRKCKRYAAAYRSIEADLQQEFGLNEAVDALKASSQSSTIYSFVFDSNENSVYLYLGRDFDTVWKFSFDTNVLETYEGFQKDTQILLDETGIPLTDLIKYQNENKGSGEKANIGVHFGGWNSGILLPVAGLLVAAAACGIGFIWIRSRKSAGNSGKKH